MATRFRKFSQHELPHPSQQAELEILALSSKSELRPEHVVGGPTPSEMLAENERKAQEHRRQKFEIIAKHGVFEEYLEPLLITRRNLTKRLTEVERDIADLEKLRDDNLRSR